MARGTEMLLMPSIDEVINAAQAIGLPPLEGMKFFHHHESKGWMIGKTKMKSLASALQTWRLGYLERNGLIDSNGNQVNGNGASHPKKLTGAEMMVREKELERVLDRMKKLENSYDSHAEMRREDREEYRSLKLRRGELKKLLGVII